MAMATMAEKRAIGAEDLDGEGSYSPEIEDWARNKKLKVEDSSTEDESEDIESKGSNSPEKEDLVQSKEVQTVEKSAAEEFQGDYDSDEEYYDEEQCRKYGEQVTASEGFDVGPVPGGIMAAIAPVRVEDIEDPSEVYIPYAIQAIEHHNKQKDAKLKFVNIVKVNAQAVCGLMYYYTIRVKDNLGEIQIYQAKVLRTFTEEGLVTEFPLFRPKANTDVVTGEGSASKDGAVDPTT